MNFFADRMKDFAQAARPTQVSQVTPSGNTRSGQGRGEDSPSAARDDRIAFEEFKKATGRSDRNPYGDAGLFGSSGDYSNNMSQGQIDRVNRQAYNQYLGLVSGRGTQRGGEGDFIPGYAPALKLGSETPSGTVVAAPNQPEPAMGGILNFLPGVGMIQRLFGGSNTLRTLDDGGVNYSTEGIETLRTPSAAPMETSNLALSPTLISAQPRNNNKFTVPFNLDQVLRDVPKTGIGRFIERGGFQFGPGTLKPEFNLKDKGFGLTFKMPIAQQDPQAFARDQALTNQNRTQLEYPEGVERKSLYEGLAPTARGLILSDIVGPTRNTELSDLSDAKSVGSPYAGTIGAFVPRRVEIGPDGRLIEIPVGFDKGGEVPAGEGLFSKEELARQEKISAAELQPDGSLPGVDTLRHATPEEVEIGSYNFLKDLEDNLRYHIKERDKVKPFEFSGVTRDRKIFHQRQVEDLEKRIQDFSSQRAAAVVNYRDYIAAGGYPLIVNTEEEPYFTGFNPDLINFRATNP